MREAIVALDDAEFAALGIDELVGLAEAAGLRDVTELACHGDGGVVRVEVETPVDEDRLRSLEYVDEWEHLSDDDTHQYVVAFSAPELSGDLAERASDLVGPCDPEMDERGATGIAAALVD